MSDLLEWHRVFLRKRRYTKGRKERSLVSLRKFRLFQRASENSRVIIFMTVGIDPAGQMTEGAKLEFSAQS
jgi:hypothetical protein